MMQANEKTETDLLGLAERCETAAGPVDELDRAIARTQGWQHFYVQKDMWWRSPNGVSHGDVLRYSASIDAAITLVAEGWRVAALCEREPWFCRLETLDFESSTWGRGSDWITDIVRGQEVTAKGAGAALAICAAAMKARALAPIDARSGETGTGSIRRTKAG